MDKEGVGYICNRIPFSHENEGNPALLGNVDGLWGATSETSQTEKDKDYLVALPRGL